MNSPARESYSAAMERLLVREVLEKYFSALDSRNWDQLRSCFLPNVHFSLFDGLVVTDTVEEAIATLTKVGRHEATHHSISNVAITLDGKTASSIIHAVVFLRQAPSSGGRMLVRGIRYVDHLVHGEDGWKISRRAHIPQWQYEADPMDTAVLKSKTSQG